MDHKKLVEGFCESLGVHTPLEIAYGLPSPTWRIVAGRIKQGGVTDDKCYTLLAPHQASLVFNDESSICHECCHAALAEKRGEIFAMVRATEKVAEIIQYAPLVGDVPNMVLDVVVNHFRHYHFPGFTERELTEMLSFHPALEGSHLQYVNAAIYNRMRLFSKSLKKGFPEIQSDGSLFKISKVLKGVTKEASQLEVEKATTEIFQALDMPFFLKGGILQEK